jgi:putative transposase
LIENLAEFYGEARWQRCVVHFYRNAWMAAPSGKVREVHRDAQRHPRAGGPRAARQKAEAMVIKLQQLKGA